MSDNKVLLAAVNSRYIHSNTAVYYLDRILKGNGIDSVIGTFSINDDKHDILASLISHGADIICFSCYIWNISLIYELCHDIRQIDSTVKIVLGGPEVTYEPAEALEKSSADLIVRGEGEDVICDVVTAMLDKRMPDCPGCFYKKDAEIIDTGIAVTGDLDSIPSPFTESMLEKEKDRLIYYEASRGCPYNCIYCLSSAAKGVRYFSLDRVFCDLGSILKYEPKVIKFTDRSFNTDEKRTLQILEYINGLDTDTCFHLEIYPAGLTDDVMNALMEMPHGRVQLEAGIQSVNEATLKSSGRVQDPQKALANMEKLVRAGNMHIHMDLIAGLPEEDILSFRHSFNKTIKAKPHMLQVGFLKLLKGTSARELEGYSCEQSPPYEVFSTPWLSYQEMCEIKNVEKCVELFYNTGRFAGFLAYMHEKTGDPYGLYLELNGFMEKHSAGTGGISRDMKYRILTDFAGNDKEAIENLRYDFMSSYTSRNVPDFLGGTSACKEDIFDWLKDDRNKERYFPEFPGASPRKLYKLCSVGSFQFNGKMQYFLFKYTKRDRVSGCFASFPIKFKPLV